MFTENNKFQCAYIKRQALLGKAPTTRLVFWWTGPGANLTSQRWNATGRNVMMHTENICLSKNVRIMPFPELAESRQGCLKTSLTTGTHLRNKANIDSFCRHRMADMMSTDRLTSAYRMKAGWQDLLLRHSGCSYWISKSLLCHLQLDRQWCQSDGSPSQGLYEQACMDDSRKDNSPWSQAEINPALDVTVWLFGTMPTAYVTWAVTLLQIQFDLLRF